MKYFIELTTETDGYKACDFLDIDLISSVCIGSYSDDTRNCTAEGKSILTRRIRVVCKLNTGVDVVLFDEVYNDCAAKVAHNIYMEVTNELRIIGKMVATGKAE